MLTLTIEELYCYRYDFEKGLYTVLNHNVPAENISFVLQETEQQALQEALGSLPLGGLPDAAYTEDGFTLPDFTGIDPARYLRFQWMQLGKPVTVKLDKNCSRFEGPTGALGHALMELYEVSQKMILAKPDIAAAPKSRTMLM